MAFDYFRSQKVDYAIIEVGLGGRLDATNVLTPLVTVCTDISYDHVEILGDTLTHIATEKAGIIKPGVPHVIGLLPRDAHRVMTATCRRKHAKLVTLDRAKYATDETRLCLDYRTTGLALRKFRPALMGVHQLKNTLVALQTLTTLRGLGVTISKQAIVNGLENTSWPGRFQVIRLPRRPVMVLDVCHNEAGAVAFADTFEKTFRGKKALLLFGVVKRKDHQAMLDALTPVAAEFHLTPLDTRRSMPPREMIATLDFHGVPVHPYRDLARAVQHLLRRARPDDILVVAGSHYLVGEFLQKYVKDARA